MDGTGAAEDRDGFDRAAAVTRSLLGYGVLAGAFYLVVGLVLAVTRDGFELTSHPLSLLMLGDWGWVQRTNLIVTGLMVLAAALGFFRALAGSTAGTRAGGLLAVYGVALLVSGAFAPDPMGGFPAGSDDGEATASGLVHLAAGGVGFLALAAAAVVVGAWFAARGRGDWALRSRLAAALIVVGFLGGAASGTGPVGVLLLWIAVVAGWVWLAGVSIQVYRTVPHPDAAKRAPA